LDGPASFFGLERGGHEEGGAAGCEVVGEGGEESSGRSETVGPAVEREVHPGVFVALRAGRGEVRWIREDPVEPSDACREVGSHHLDRKPFLACRGREGPERRGIPVRRHHRPAGPAGREAQRTVPASDLEEAAGTSLLGEREQELSVLSDRIDGPFERIGLRYVWT
jgi:hypothetical protein